MRESSFESRGRLAGWSRFPSPAAVACSPRWLALATAVATFLLLFRGGSPPYLTDLDSSWTLVLAWALRKPLQWGSDLVFTYGPLGSLVPFASYFPDSHVGYFVGQCGLSLAAAFIVHRFAGRVGWGVNLVLIGLLVAWYGVLPADVGYCLMFALAATVLFHEVESGASPRRLALLLGGGALVFSVLALGKFTLLILWLVLLAYVVALLAVHRRRHAALATALAWPALLVILWLACGQHASGLFDYVRGGLELASGYAAMTLSPPAWIDVCGLLVLLALAASLLRLARGAQVATWLLAAFLGLMGLMVWRGGFVRADAHVAIFFATASFIGLAAWGARPPRMLATGVAFGAALLVGLWASYAGAGAFWGIGTLGATLQQLAAPLANRVQLREAWDAQARQWDLPQTRMVIGDHSVDLLMNQQGVALVNHFNYLPRPVFQGYAAFTPQLARINERHLLGAHAPDYLLADFGAIDERYPTADDPLTVLAAMRAYEPVGAERNFLLFAKRADAGVAPVGEPAAAQWREATIDAEVDVAADGAPRLLYYDASLSVLGHLYALLLREPELAIEVTLADGSKATHRLMRQNGAAGLLLSPYLGNSPAYLRWYAGLTDPNVTHLRVFARKPWQAALFADRFRYALTPVDLPRQAATGLTPALREALYPRFDPAPARVEGHSELRDEAGIKVLLAHAPSMLQFDLAPGRWSGHGVFGVMAAAYDLPQCQASDGIELVAEHVAANGEVRELLRRAIDPIHEASQRGAQPFAYGPVTTDAGDTIRLRLDPGPNGSVNTDCDWSYVAEVAHESTPVMRVEGGSDTAGGEPTLCGIDTADSTEVAAGERIVVAQSRPLRLGGWAGPIDGSPEARKLRLILTGSDGIRYVAPIRQTVPRPDVAAVFDNPGFAEGGFDTEVDLSQVPVGFYRAFLAQGRRAYCDPARSVEVRVAPR